MPAAAVVKVVLTNRTAARAKFGAGGWRRVRSAVTALADADKSRGITTRFFALDSAADCRRVGTTPVTAVTDAQQVKAAVDAVSAAWEPAYLLILGGPDLVPLVNLDNPLWTGDPADDPDPFIPSDLPYACDSAYSTVASNYRGPTRVVGRVADLTGIADTGPLLTQLAQATAATSLARLSPEPVFVVTAKVWAVSTGRSVAGLPDVTGVVNSSPAAGPVWTPTQTAPTLHFVNCHGSEFDPNWYGQATPGNWNLPTAVAANSLPALVAGGQVVAAECCYGTAHWPAAAANGQASVAMTYLTNGAAGVFGASTVAYGPATTNDYADVICRLFVEEVLSGASTGRATLVARQRFIQSQAFLDPTDVKTLAQFALLGDPSAVAFVNSNSAIATAAPTAAPKGGRSRRAVLATPRVSTSAVLARRETMAAVGAALDRTTRSAAPLPRPRAQLSTRALAGLIGRDVPRGVRIRTFDTERAEGPMRATRSPRTHVAFLPPARRGAASLVVVREQPGGDPEVRQVFRK